MLLIFLFFKFLIAHCLTVLRSLVVVNFARFNLSSNIVPKNLLKSSVVIIYHDQEFYLQYL